MRGRASQPSQISLAWRRGGTRPSKLGSQRRPAARSGFAFDGGKESVEGELSQVRLDAEGSNAYCASLRVTGADDGEVWDLEFTRVADSRLHALIARVDRGAQSARPKEIGRASCRERV